MKDGGVRQDGRWELLVYGVCGIGGGYNRRGWRFCGGEEEKRDGKGEIFAVGEIGS